MDNSNPFHCDVCNISVNSERILEDHCRGKKHQKNLELQSDDSYCTTVRVWDFPPGQYVKEMLWQYFERYGPIDDIEQDYWNPGLAYVNYKKPGSAVTCLKQKRHKIDEFIIKVEAVDSGLKLDRKPKKKPEKKAAPEDGELTSKLLQEPSVEAQIRLLTSQLEMKVTDSTVHKELVDSLQQIFNNYFPGCIVYRFGSSLNGLGTRGCDLDIFLDLNLDKPLSAQQARKLPRPYPNVSDIPSFEYMRGRFMSRDELGRVPIYDQTRLCSKILLAEGQFMGISSVQTIPGTRCPIVRFVHGPSGVQVDMSLNNRVALRNTQLLLLYQQIEPRFHPLVFVIREWAKKAEVCGSSSVGQKLSSYAVVMLAVFYLQNCKPPVLPTVQELADLATGDDKMCVYNWDCSFTSDKKIIPATSNESNVVELVAGFFEFYSSFDFVNRLVSPRTGRAMPLADLSVEFKSSVLQNFRIAPICIQDPFVMDHNVAQNMNELSRNKLIAAFKVAANKVRTASFNEPGELQAWGLPYLFSAEEIALTTTALPTKQTKHMISIPMTFGSCPKLFTIAVMLEVDLNEGWCQYVSNSFQYIVEDILMAKVEVLLDRTNPKLKIGVVEVDPESGVAKPGQKRAASDDGNSSGKKTRTDVDDENGDHEEKEDKDKARLEEAEQDQSMLLVMRCRFFDKVWVNRRNFAGKTALKTADLNFEKQVSKQLIDSGDTKMYCPMEIWMEIRHKLDPCQVICGMELMGDESAKGDFNTFAAFMDVFHVKVLNQL